MNRWGIAVAALAFLAAPTAWVVTDRLEERNAFCVSCHFASGVPLHQGNHEDFRARPPVSLAVAHAVAGNRERADGAFRCIDCHGGVGLVGRARVKLLSAKDAFWYVSGRFEEPDGMHWPLRDEDCARCHASFAERAPEEWGDPAFHELAVHNHELGVDCVACHSSHETGGLSDHFFVQPLEVRAQCARCHPEFELEEDSP